MTKTERNRKKRAARKRRWKRAKALYMLESAATPSKMKNYIFHALTLAIIAGLIVLIFLTCSQ